MKWYETQIVGVIAGGLIVFCSNWFFRWNENRIERNKLKAGINSIDNNITKIGILEKSIIKQIIELKGLNCAFAKGLNILIEQIPFFKEHKIEKSTIESLLITAENSIKKLQEINGKILHLTS